MTDGGLQGMLVGVVLNAAGDAGEGHAAATWTLSAGWSVLIPSASMVNNICLTCPTELYKHLGAFCVLRDEECWLLYLSWGQRSFYCWLGNLSGTLRWEL